MYNLYNKNTKEYFIKTKFNFKLSYLLSKIEIKPKNFENVELFNVDGNIIIENLENDL